MAAEPSEALSVDEVIDILGGGDYEIGRNRVLDILDKVLISELGQSKSYEYYYDYTEEAFPDWRVAELIDKWDDLSAESKQEQNGLKDYVYWETMYQMEEFAREYNVFGEQEDSVYRAFFDACHAEASKVNGAEYEPASEYEWYDFSDLGYVEWADDMTYYDFDLKDRMSGKTIYADVMFGKDDEWNCEFTTIRNLKDLIYGMTSEGYHIGFDKEDEGDMERLSYSLNNNAAIYLLRQQGYNPEDLLDRDIRGKFIDSFRAEMDECYAQCARLTALVSMPLNDYLDLIDGAYPAYCAKSNGQGGFFSLGFYDPWSGGGGVLEIALDKPFTFPASLVSAAKIATNKEKYSYTAMDTYGIATDSYVIEIEPADSTPSIPDLASVEIDAFADALIRRHKEYEEEDTE